MTINKTQGQTVKVTGWQTHKNVLQTENFTSVAVKHPGQTEIFTSAVTTIRKSSANILICVRMHLSVCLSSFCLSVFPSVCSCVDLLPLLHCLHESVSVSACICTFCLFVSASACVFMCCFCLCICLCVCIVSG